MFAFMNQSTGFARLRTIFVAVSLLFCSVSVSAEGAAVTVRSADLKRSPSHSAETIINLSQGETIEVGPRKGAWFRAWTTDGITGWIRMLAVRYQAASPEGSMLDSLSKASRSKTTIATGVRGLDKEMLAEAEPNHARLQELIAFPYNASDARQFARQGGLKAREAAYR